MHLLTFNCEGEVYFEVSFPFPNARVQSVLLEYEVMLLLSSLARRICTLFAEPISNSDNRYVVIFTFPV